MLDVMIDLETMGLGPDGAVVSIGAAKFDPYEKVPAPLGAPMPLAPTIVNTFKVNIDLQSALNAGLKVTASTLDFWAKQEPAARAALRDPEPIPLRDALREFRKFYEGTDHVWCNAPTFDFAILRNAYTAFAQPAPWHWRHERDQRTIMDLHSLTFGHGVDQSVPWPTLLHDAKDDAMRQAVWLWRALKELQRHGT